MDTSLAWPEVPCPSSKFMLHHSDPASVLASPLTTAVQVLCFSRTCGIRPSPLKNPGHMPGLEVTLGSGGKVHRVQSPWHPSASCKPFLACISKHWSLKSTACRQEMIASCSFSQSDNFYFLKLEYLAHAYLTY